MTHIEILTELKRCLGRRGVPTINGFSNPGTIENGKIVCSDRSCATNCNTSYDTYGGQSRTHCKQAPSGKWVWTSRLGVCKTCSPLHINDQNISVSFRHTF